MSGSVNIEFTVYGGDDVADMQNKALDHLNKLMPGREWEYRLDVRPVAYFVTGDPISWQCDVTAVPKAPT